MKLIGCNSTDFQGLDLICGTHRSCRCEAHSPQAPDPIPVQVRLRRYGDAWPEVRRVSRTSPNLGRLPVGSTLDCYI
jgi:hypothetical protein